MWRRRAACLLVAALGCARSRPAPAGPPDLTIVYMGDLRGAVASPAHAAGGLARRATAVDRLRLSAPALVQVDAGDLAPAAEDDPGLVDGAAREARARLALRAYRRMGVDAITVGERDLALGAAKWRALCEEAKVPIVAANIVGPDGQPVFPASRLVRAGEIAVGLLGLLEPPPQGWAAPPGVAVTDAVVAARAAVQSLRGQGARVIVGLFHVAGGSDRAREIAAAAGVDLVVLGHGGEPAPPRIVRASPRGVDLGRVDVRAGGGGPPQLENHLLPVGADVPEQRGVYMLVRVASGPIAATFRESVAAMKAAGISTYGENWTFGSTALCSGCHAPEAAQWQTTDHAHAFSTLEKAGKSRDPACMGCHFTGFLLPGGAQNFESAAQFQNVGCEDCHGPSVAHVASADKRAGTSRAVAPTVCLGCHTPDQNVGPFVVAAAMREIVGPGHGLPAH
ncbi:MAG TPA: multiheme c-type cytochrome [Polyangia bacterium]|nr:multiheme c-type cytochrome [Polyangia bacterium]